MTNPTANLRKAAEQAPANASIQHSLGLLLAEKQDLSGAVAAFEAGDGLVANAEVGEYEVLIVDDASTDDTALIADKLSAEHDNVRVVHHETNRKLGGSLKTGFANARDRGPRRARCWCPCRTCCSR